MTVWRKERRLFLWAYSEYSDIFEGSERRHTQSAVEVIFNEDPSKVLPTNISEYTLDFIVVGTKYNSAI